MKVKQLKINSFRGIRDLTLDFDLNEPTVFIGINGVGKSSILDCLAILLSWFNASIQNIRNEGIYFSDSDINNQSSRTQNKITVCTPHLEDFSWSLIKRNPDFLFPKGKQYVNNIKKLVLKIYDNYNNGILGSLPIAIYYPTQRAVLDIILETKQEDLFETFKAYDLALTPQKINFNSFFEWFRNREI